MCSTDHEVTDFKPLWTTSGILKFQPLIMCTVQLIHEPCTQICVNTSIIIFILFINYTVSISSVWLFASLCIIIIIIILCMYTHSAIHQYLISDLQFATLVL